MRNTDTRRILRSSSAPIYSFDTDASFDRVIRDPMAVLLGRSSLTVQRETVHTDPYNRVGRWMRTRT